MSTNTRHDSLLVGSRRFTTFSPVAKLSSFRTFLTLAARHDWEIESFDFNAAYLNGELDDDEEIYMHPPPGYDSDPNTVKRLCKVLYGLKQAGRKWYDTLSHALADIGFSVTLFHLYVIDIHDFHIMTSLPLCILLFGSPNTNRFWFCRCIDSLECCYTLCGT